MGGSPANAQQEKLVLSHQLDLSPHQSGWPPDPLMQRWLGEYARGDAAARPCGNPNDSCPADERRPRFIPARRWPRPDPRVAPDSARTPGPSPEGILVDDLAKHREPEALHDCKQRAKPKASIRESFSTVCHRLPLYTACWSKRRVAATAHAQAQSLACALLSSLSVHCSGQIRVCTTPASLELGQLRRSELISASSRSHMLDTT